MFADAADFVTICGSDSCSFIIKKCRFLLKDESNMSLLLVKPLNGLHESTIFLKLYVD